MIKVLLWIATVIVAGHGLIHLLGYVAYWPLARVAELPYKTALAGGRWEVGPLGMKLYALLWLIATAGYALALVDLHTGQSWWRPVMLATTALSTALILLDWAPAFRGAIVNLAILALMGLLYLLPTGLSAR
ncbi:MAG: ABC transporter permease [Bacillota bacterium]